ncbi:SGNH/GDSL hydrolase family protein [Algibacter amylolyticus]|uniref:SGNH/GDSL hydrolase family protein n=1 Tax=Algibacter amylolyticus TaxID=1608400 RepID=A0A5M7B6H4_9FLAO|nr:SGNH/GDSL hydrolase family protein [Algibacter amylolyticus]KAA5825143.1 SGNH/GDSL hydrolase family protein [Algibacter amylolyticus]TSJ77637.1 SGNH/GDSL hydrolase family protein [Algibacter amylolyticus]
MIKTKVLLILTAVMFVFMTSFSFKQPKILIIGDSISLGYTPFVKQHLADKAIVSHNQGNAQHTGKGLANIKDWVTKDDYDIIQFNWGLWDLCYRDLNSKNQGRRDKINGTITYSVEDYAANLDSIVSTIKAQTKVKLIFVTTTYVPENEAGRFEEDVIKYNNAAKKVMEKHAVEVNDIYKKSIPIHNKYKKKTDDVHYTKEGYEALSKLIIDFLETEIKKY